MTMFSPSLDLTDARILVVNDDGIRAPGLKVLESIAKSFTKDVWVFAPEEEKSGAGHSLSLSNAIRVTKLSPRRYAVNGSPTDCVILAMGEYLKDKHPDLVLSGINRGGNLGDDVTYSGTVAGAMEATLLGIPAIALSQEVRGEKEQFKTTAAHACSVIERLLKFEWPSDVFMNVNFPDVPPEEVSGVSMVPQGRRKSGYELHQMPNPRRPGHYYVIGTVIAGAHYKRGNSDHRTLEHGKISITPLHCDLTHYGALRKLRMEFE
jgi:5'-nucleotidase